VRVTLDESGTLFTNAGTITASAANESDISIRADRINWAGGSFSATAGGINIRPTTNTRDIQLGGTADTSKLSITQVDLATLDTPTLTIGRLRTNTGNFEGNIHLAGSVDLFNKVTTLTLASGANPDSSAGNITQASGATLGVANLNLRQHVGSTTLTEANSVGVLTAQAGQGGSIAFTGFGGFMVGAAGVSTQPVDDAAGSGTITLIATTGDITINGAINASGARSGDVLDRAPSAILIDAQDGSLTINGSNILSLDRGPVSAGSETAGATGGNIDLRASGALTINGNVLINSSGGSASGPAAFQGAGADAGNITLIGSSITTSDGTVTIVAVGGDGLVGGQVASNAIAPQSGGAGGVVLFDTAGTVSLDTVTIVTFGGKGSSRLDEDGFRGEDGAGAAFVMDRPLVLSGGTVSILTGDADLKGADITFEQAVTGPGNLTLNAGSSYEVEDGKDTGGDQLFTTVDGGDILFSVPVGANGAPVGTITIDRARNVTTNGVVATGFIQTDRQSTGITRLNTHNFGGATGTVTLLVGANGISIANNEIRSGAGSTLSGGTFRTFAGGDVRFFTQTTDLTLDDTTFDSAGGLAFRAADTIGSGVSSRAGQITIDRGTFTTPGGDVTFESPTLLARNVTIDTREDTGAIDSAGGDVRFQSTLDNSGGVRTLTINAGTTGNVFFDDLVGNASPLAKIEIVSANDVTGSGLRATEFLLGSGFGTLTFNGGSFDAEQDGFDQAALQISSGNLDLTSQNITVNGAITAPAGSITLNATAGDSGVGTIVLSGGGGVFAQQQVSLTANDSITSSGTLISDTAGISLLAEAGGGDVIIDDGSLKAAQAVTVTSTAGKVRVEGDIESTGSTVTISGLTGIELGGSVTTDSGAISLQQAVVLVGSSSALTSASGDITLASTVDGNTAFGQALEIDAGSGSISLGGAVGATTEVGDLTLASSAVITLDKTIDARSLTVSGGGLTDIHLSSINTQRRQTYDNPIVLRQDFTASSDGSGSNGNIAFNSTVDSFGTDGFFSLTVNTAGTTTFAGALGSTRALSSLTTDAAGDTRISGATVRTTGTQSFNDAVIIGGDTTLVSTGSGASGDVLFASTVDSASGSGSPFALTVDTAGTTTFRDEVGGSDALASLAVNNASGTVLLDAGSIITTGAQTYSVAQILLDTDMLLRSTANAAIDLSGPVNNVICEINTLTIETQGETIFNNRVGMFRPLGALTTDGLPSETNIVTFNTDRIVTLGAQTFGELVNLSTGGGETIQFISRDRGTIDFQAGIEAAVAGVHAEIMTSGATRFGGDIGAHTALASLTTDAGGTVAFSGSLVRTTGDQTFNELTGITLGHDMVFESTSGTGTITFGGPIGSMGGQTYDLTVTNAGLTSFAGNLGVASPAGNGLIGNLVIDGGGTARFDVGDVRTVGSQTYEADLVLADDAVFVSTGDDTIDFQQRIDSDDEASPRSLLVETSGQTRFAGPVGDNAALLSLETDSGGTVLLDGASVRTVDFQLFNEQVTLSGTTTLTSTEAGEIRFADTLDGPGGLIVNTAGDTIFDEVVGADEALASVFTDGPGRVLINGGAVTTTGLQSWNEVALLGADTVLTSTDSGDIRFGSTLDGAFSLTVNTSGATVFDGLVGGETALTSVLTDTGGTVAINGGGVTTTGSQTYLEVATLGAATVLVSEEDGDIVFADTLDSAGDEGVAIPYGLTVNTGGETRFDGVVGGRHALASVFTDADGSVVVNAGLVRTTGNQAFNELSGLVLPMDTRFIAIDGGDIRFGGPIGSGNTDVHSLTVTTAGLITFDGPLGVPTADAGNGLLENILVDGGGTAQFNNGDVRSVAAQTYDADLVLADDAVFVSTGDDTIDFQRRIDSDGVESRSLLVETSGATRFGGAVGENAALTSVETDAGGTVAIDGGLVRTIGFQLYNELATLAANAVLTSIDAGEIRFVETLDGPGGLTVNTGGETIFDGVVGGNTALASAFTDGPGLVRINGGAVTTTGLQNWNDAAVLGVDTVLTSTGNGQVRFGSTVNGPVALIINTGGATVFDGVVGGAQALTSVFTDAGGTVAINGGAVTTTGAQTYNEVATLGANTVLTSTGAAPIEFANTLNGGFALQINTAGQTRFGGAVGATAALASVATDGPGSVLFAGPLVRTTGAQTFGENALLLGNDVEFVSLGNGAILFGGGPNGARSMTVNTGGAVTFNGIPGGAAALANLTVFAGTLSGRDMVASGNILLDVRDRITLGNVQAGVDLEVRSDRDVLFDGAISVGRNLRSVTGRGGVVGGVTQLRGTIRVGGDAEFVADTVRNQIDDLTDMVVGGRLAFTNANRGSWRSAIDFRPIITNNFEVLRPFVTPRVNLGDLPIPSIGVVSNDINLIGFAIAEVEEITELSDESFADLIALFGEVAEARTQARMVVVGGGVSEVGREAAADVDGGDPAPSDATTDRGASPVDDEDDDDDDDDDDELQQSESEEDAGAAIAAGGWIENDRS
jgi:hypothetical protein